MTSQELIDYYKSLLILQYASQPNALATMQSIVGKLVQDQIIQQVTDGFDVDTAIGAQLDILGTYVGQSRIVFGLLAGDFWAMPEYADAAYASYFGWAEYADTDPTWNWLLYNDVNSLAYTLSDSQMRRMIKLRAALRSSANGLGDLDDILYSFFGVYLNLQDNQDMSIIYVHQLADPDIDGLFQIAVLSDALPHQAGVAFSTVEV